MNIKQIIEATETELQADADIHWNDASINTPFVQKILADYAKSKKLSILDVQDAFEKELNETISFLNETPIMSKTALKGAVEQTLFNYIPEDLSDIDFNIKMLNEMFTYVMGTYAQYFPLRNSKGIIVSPSVQITPSVFEQPEWMKSITTAAASPEGDIVFNEKFAKELIYYARQKGIKGNASYYKSNGGEVPDEYAYIEFLIRHEMGHIMRSDGDVLSKMLADYLEANKDKYPKLLKKFNFNTVTAAHRVNNFTADYIMNYQLVASGLPQLPIGLFSEDINYTKQKHISDMYKIILDEMEVQSAAAQEQQKNQMDDHLDSQKNNEKTQDDQNSQQGSGDGEKSQQGEQGDQQGQSSDSQQGEESDQENKSKQKSSLDTSKADKQAKEALKKQKESISNTQKSQEKLKQEIKDAQEKINKIKNNDIQQRLKDLRNANNKGIDFDETYSAKFTWQTIIKRMMPTDSQESEETYSRVSKRNAAGLQQLKQSGMSAAKPGEINIDADKKNVLFVIDNSGSVMSTIAKVNQEINKLISKHSKNLDKLIIIKFDTDFVAYSVDLKKQKAFKITNPSTLLKNKNTKLSSNSVSMKSLFSTDGLGGGTEFSSELTKICESLLKRNTNMILFSDTDLLDDSNAKNLNYLISKYGKSPFKVNIIMDSESSFNSFVKNIKAYKYLSYFKLN